VARRPRRDSADRTGSLRPPASRSGRGSTAVPAPPPPAGDGWGKEVRLPERAIVLVTGTDPDGDALARPVEWDSSNGPPPSVLMEPEARGQPALAIGDRVLAHLRPSGAGRYAGRTIRSIADAPARILGVYRHGRIVPTDRRARARWAMRAPSA
jgi:ribonuclease R